MTTPTADTCPYCCAAVHPDDPHTCDMDLIKLRIDSLVQQRDHLSVSVEGLAEELALARAELHRATRQNLVGFGKVEVRYG